MTASEIYGGKREICSTGRTLIGTYVKLLIFSQSNKIGNSIQSNR